ncbi:MAG: hypothetical protein GXP25_05235 [Planctomycetes bacterium]|nr:hypothetical protein [Planctomycetota bacterium]
MTARTFYLLSRDARFRGYDSALALAECIVLTQGTREEERIVSSDRVGDISRAAFTAFGAEEIARAESLDDLREKVREAALDLPDFRIEVVKIPGRLRDNSLDIQRRIAEVMVSRPDLLNPKQRLVAIRTETLFRFGRIVTEASTDWGRPLDLPERCSRSIPDRIGRAMVNLAASPGDRILDPCCGAGTIPIQAMQVGIETDASDINFKMVGATNLNLARLGYPPCAEVADLRERKGRWDAVVTDLPYGWFGHEEEHRQVDDILDHLVTLAPRIVVATASPRHAAFEGGRFARVEAIPLPVSPRRSRYIHVAVEKPASKAPAL